MRDVLPVTTLTLLVRKKMVAISNLLTGTRHIMKAASGLLCDGLESEKLESRESHSKHRDSRS